MLPLQTKKPVMPKTSNDPKTKTFENDYNLMMKGFVPPRIPNLPQNDTVIKTEYFRKFSLFSEEASGATSTNTCMIQNS